MQVGNVSLRGLRNAVQADKRAVQVHAAGVGGLGALRAACLRRQVGTVNKTAGKKRDRDQGVLHGRNSSLTNTNDTKDIAIRPRAMHYRGPVEPPAGGLGSSGYFACRLTVPTIPGWHSRLA